MRSSIRTLWPLALCLVACEYGSGPRTSVGSGDGDGTSSALTITSSAPGEARVGQAYAGAVDVTGGTPPYALTLASLPAGLGWLALDPATGALSGVPTESLLAGAEVVVQVTDSLSQTATVTLSLTVTLCDANTRTQAFYAAADQCLYDLQVCSMDGGILSQEAGTPSSDMNHCGASADGASTCGACSSDTADACVAGRCACGIGRPCSGEGVTCCSGACVPSGAGCGTYVCPQGSMRCSEGCCPQAMAVSAGGSATCALFAANADLGVPPGTVKCWGYGKQGQLGAGTQTSSSLPIPAAKLSDVVRLEAGDAFFCAVTASGSARCWGNGPHGELGNGTSSGGPGQAVGADANNPLTNVVGLAAGASHACAFTSGGSSAWCWGENGDGELGNNGDYRIDAYVPVTAGLPSAVTAMTAGTRHTCALCADQGVYCWGSGGLWGPDVYGYRVPQLTGVSGVTDIASGGAHVCAITPERTVKCWGSNASGELGNGTVTSAFGNGAVGVVDASGALLSGVVKVAGGGAHTCALTGSGGVWCWGRNQAGQLGHDSSQTCTVWLVESSVQYPCTLSAAPVFGLASGAVDISAGEAHTCAALKNGGVKCWGSNASGQLGNGSVDADRHPAPIDVLF